MQNRASKKQRELLNFIDTFIKENGYSPSYREIMRALDYKSVSTVAVHVDGLIARGYLRKTDNSARSLEVLASGVSADSTNLASHIAWLRRELKKRQADQTEQAQGEALVLTKTLAIFENKE